ncbi:OmpA family protein [Spirosoma sp. HMF3257]|uniref:OmpA-like domain-containing protein n=1 Tax=Spirosoma telluris TaxID=2183553 RepID=A0A327NSP1_9BACT|nr:OmpA family protein [Spirosoma telluris]RAI77479.1 hypothetical protein HMF3257_30830 [Spirosoma telluris]
MGKVLICSVLLILCVRQLVAFRIPCSPPLGSGCLTITTQLDSLATSTLTELPLSIYILYFDQSSPNLRPGDKATLDSLAEKLVKQPTLLATVTGYTDNVGKRELNLVLAEYRAKTVANYLRQRGVLADQIVAKWEGPDKKASAEDPEAVKTISRRVVVLLAPR